MSALDTAADKLRSKSQDLAGQGGIKDKLAAELADDADFLRKLKPDLIKKRMKGEAPTDQQPKAAPRAPSGPQLGSRPKPKRGSGGSGGGGALPFVVVGAALAVGVFVAKWLDWRGHAHPRL
jgi:hypothetical protein